MPGQRRLTGVWAELDGHQPTEGRQAASAGGEQARQLIRQASAAAAAAAAAAALAASWRRLALLAVRPCGGTRAGICLALRLACSTTHAHHMGTEWLTGTGG